MKLNKSLQKLFVCSIALASIAGLGASASNMNANASRRHHHHIVRLIKQHHKVHHYRKRNHKRHKTMSLKQMQKRLNKRPTYYYDDSTNTPKFQSVLQSIREGIASPKAVNHALKTTVGSMNTVTNREVDILEAEIESGSEWYIPKSTLYLMKYNMTNKQAMDIANCARANHKPYYVHIFGNLKQSGYQYKLPEQSKSHKHHEHYYKRPGIDDPSKGFHHHYNFGHDPFHGVHLSDKKIHHYTHGSRMKFGHHKGHFYVG